MRADDLRGEFGEQADDIVAIAESYVEAATELGLDMDAVKRAILSAAREWGGCVSCRFSRAPRDAAEYARQRGSLPVMMRTCLLGLRQETCSARESVFPE